MVILSNMANMNALPSDPASDLDAAEAARRRLTGTLRLPSWFHTALGAAVAVQVATTAYGIAEQSGAGLLVVAAGFLVFLAVAVVLLARFRTLNGVWVERLASRAVLGMSNRSSLVHLAAVGGAIWAAFEGQPWLVALAAVLGGAGYAASSRLWWQEYMGDPAGHARAESRVMVALVAVSGLSALVVLVLYR
ncbi:MAG: hypothetical protein QOD98_1801 [Nocardioidaceae bacterium]|nr:hypothetical protein [Nocardioidaceae bacterium]